MPAKRVLICAPLIPEFDRESGSRRIFHLVELFLELGWSVTFFAENMTGAERYARVLRQRGAMVYGGVHSHLISDEYLPNPIPLLEFGRFDLAVVAFWSLAEELLPLFRSYTPDTRVLIDSVDLHFLRLSRKIFTQDDVTATPNALDNDYASNLTRELNIYAAADGVLTVSQKEADLINDFLATPHHAHAVPDMEELPASPIPFADREGILFVGNFRHPPNVDAVAYLFEEILPRIDSLLLQRHPLLVVGNAMDDAIHALGKDQPHVKMVGWVPSLLPYLNKVGVSITPLRYGAGTKRKVIETLSVGTPCISTHVGAEGLNLKHGQHIWIADDPDGFAAGISRVLSDESLWTRLAKKGRAHILRSHGGKTTRNSLEKALFTIFA